MSAPCTVKLDLFEGPLDLLLHLIKKNEVEIADIPIAAITDQYLALIEGVEALDLDNAGEYLVMAATLTFIKSRMLLPNAPRDDDEADEDPRSELVQQLLEYQRYREAAAHLASRPLLARDVFAAIGEPPEPGDAGEDGPPVRDATLGDLLEALRGVLERTARPKPHEILRPMRSVGECVQGILARFALAERVEFHELFDRDAGRDDVVVTFLALLELVRLRVVRARQDERFGAITLSLGVDSLGEAAERVRDLSLFDSWRGGGGGEGHADANR
jgi:segregation and condensation protein A